MITSQERLRPGGPSQARMRPLALQTDAQSAPSADCHWPRYTGSPGRLSGLRDREMGQREGVRSRWHSEVGGSCCSPGQVNTLLAIKPGPPGLHNLWPGHPCPVSGHHDPSKEASSGPTAWGGVNCSLARCSERGVHLVTSWSEGHIRWAVWPGQGKFPGLEGQVSGGNGFRGRGESKQR